MPVFRTFVEYVNKNTQETESRSHISTCKEPDEARKMTAAHFKDIAKDTTLRVRKIKRVRA